MKTLRRFRFRLTKKSAHKAALVCCMIVVAFFNGIPVQAFEDFYSDSEIQFIDPNACDPDAPPPVSADPSLDQGAGSSAAGNVYIYLVEQGLKPQGAAGVIGNLMVESGGKTYNLNPRITNGNHWGIAQWDAGRFDKLKQHAATLGKSPWSLEAQQSFIMKELAGMSELLATLKSTTSPETAAADFDRLFERSGGGSVEIRKDLAKKAFQDFGSGSGLTASTDLGGAVSQDEACCAGSANLSPGLGTPSGTTYPSLDAATMTGGINTFLEGSPLENLGENFVATGKAANVNPFMLVGIALIESSLGRAIPGGTGSGSSFNSFGRSATESQPHVTDNNGVISLWYKWSSYKASVDPSAAENSGENGDIGEYIRSSGFYDKGLESGKIEDIIEVYAPKRQNNFPLYVKTVRDAMKKMADGSGPTVPGANATPDANVCCPDPTAGGVTSDIDASTPADWQRIYETDPEISRAMDKGSIGTVKKLIIHYTQTEREGSDLLSEMVNNNVGVQFNIGKTGKVYQVFPLSSMKMTYHVASNNSGAIGIEISGRDGKDLMANDAQFEAVVALSKFLGEKYHIPLDDPKGDITGDPASKAQGLLGHDEAPGGGHSDPDTYFTPPGSTRNMKNLETSLPWTDAQRNDSNIHAYMKKLRTALGFDPAPGGSGGDATPTAEPSAASGQCSGAIEAGDANLKDTIKIETPGKFITMPQKYACPGRTFRIDSRVAPAMAYLISKYNMCATAGLEGGHASHGAGISVDLVPKNDNTEEGWQSSTEAAARAIGWYGDGAKDARGSKPTCSPYSGYGGCMYAVHPDKFPKWMRWLGYNGAYNHGDPFHKYGSAGAHLHISWASPNPPDDVSRTPIPNPIPAVYTFPAPIPEDIKEAIDGGS